MSEGIPVPLPHARKVANELRDMLLSVCERIEIAGSIRREKPEVKDGELVAIPRFEDGRNLLLARLDALVAENRPGGPSKALVIDKNGHTAPRWGDKFRKVAYSGINFDVFMTDEESWGYQFWLRTGPGDANHFIMGKLADKKNPAPFGPVDGEIIAGGQRVPARTERDFFALIGLPFIEPKYRTQAAYEKHFGKKHAWGNVPQLRLLWNYSPETLAAYPVPLDFMDEDSGKMWANVTLDRRNGPFQLVEKGSREAAYQREFLVGTVPQRVELERLRKILWKDQKIDVPGYFDIGDLPVTYLMTGGAGETERVPLADIIPTQPTVYRWGVYEKVQTGQQWVDWCYGARRCSREEALADIWKQAKALRFSDSERVYLIDGHHRLMGAQELHAEWVSINVTTFKETYEQACGMIVLEDDNTDYTFLNDVLEEALMILGGVPV